MLYARIGAMLADGVLDAEEQRELLETLLKFVHCREAARQNHVSVGYLADTSTTSVESPFDEPAPEIVHAAEPSSSPGEFAAIPRKTVEATITQLGGTVNGSVSRKVHFVVVGSLGNELWKGGNYGTKIEKAIELRRDASRSAS